jgi:hypothetical protein
MLSYARRRIHSAAAPRRDYRIIFLTFIIRRRRHGATAELLS